MKRELGVSPRETQAATAGDRGEGITMKVGELRRLIDALPDQAEVLVEINDSGLLSSARARVGLAKWHGHDAVTKQARFVLSAEGMGWLVAWLCVNEFYELRDEPQMNDGG